MNREARLLGLEGDRASSSSETDMLSELATIENEVGHAMEAPEGTNSQVSTCLCTLVTFALSGAYEQLKWQCASGAKMCHLT